MPLDRRDPACSTVPVPSRREADAVLARRLPSRVLRHTHPQARPDPSRVVRLGVWLALTNAGR
jgi:hypothetical protein